MIVVSDATTLIGLAKIEHLHLLPALFNTIYVPSAVYMEVTLQGVGLPGAQELAEADWLLRRLIQDRLHVDYLRADLDSGEAEALVLAQELHADYLIVDEQRARTVAYLMDIPHIGTIGVLLLAKQTGHIAAIGPLLTRLRQEKFFISDALIRNALQAAGE